MKHAEYTETVSGGRRFTHYGPVVRIDNGEVLAVDCHADGVWGAPLGEVVFSEPLNCDGCKYREERGISIEELVAEYDGVGSGNNVPE